jgi:formylglycine-generating enzyme required for sulfatase activity
MAAVPDPRMDASIGLLKRIPAGYLHAGSGFHPRELARRQTIYVREYDIASSTVTVNQYLAFIKARGYDTERWWSEDGQKWLHGAACGWGRSDRQRPDAWERQKDLPHHPVVGVTCFEAEAYCAWLSAEKRRTVRLPTEDEWERAARGDDRRPYPWGEVFLNTLTNTVESERHETVPAASLPGDVSPFGVMDMAGNVQQWTSTIYLPLPEEIHAQGLHYVVRGGSFNDLAYGARTSYRRAYPAGYFFSFLGFRIAVETN